METATLIAAGWCSGLNAYLTVLILGVAGRFGWADTPAALHRPWVLALAAVMFAVEFVVDKVPVLDSAWDVVHTAVRPAVAAAIGASMAGVHLGQPEASLLAAGLALTGHATKATTRLAINLSPEPLTNIVASASEDGLVATLVVLALAAPEVAAVLTVAALVIGLIVAFVLLKVAVKGVGAVRQRLGARRSLDR
jgi:hypothetical protein